ncbi:MAG TPA: LUD domain-containing protein [Bacilli bacterium]
MVEQTGHEIPAAVYDEAGEGERSFLENISRRLRRPQPKSAPKHPFRGAPEFWKEYQLPVDECIRTFIDHWESAGGKAIRTSGDNELRQTVIEILQTHHITSVIRQNQPKLAELLLDAGMPEARWKTWSVAERGSLAEFAAQADAGVVIADYAVAHTGTVVLGSSSDKGRSVSLLPPLLVVIVPISRLRTRLGEVMRDLQEISSAQFPAGVHFVSGPSRSADIENDLTIGVHGPGIVYAIMADF